jgi:hypothetical protein
MGQQPQPQQQQHVETTCGSLLRELQVWFLSCIRELFYVLDVWMDSTTFIITVQCSQCSWNSFQTNGKACGVWVSPMQHIWDEVGENDSERDKMLLQLEQECLEVYRRKVDHASHARAQLHQDLVNAEAELAALFSSLGDPAVSQQRVSFLPSSTAFTYGLHVKKH